LNKAIIILSGLLLLCLVIIFNRNNEIGLLQQDREKYKLEIENSKLKQEKLLEEINILKDNIEILAEQKNSLTSQINNKKIERIEIIKYVDNQIENINDISIDSTIVFLADRLSQTNINK
jgi:hypothetical protein